MNLFHPFAAAVSPAVTHAASSMSPASSGWLRAAARALKPAFALPAPVVRRMGFKWMALGAVAGAAGYLLWRGLRNSEEGRKRAATKPPEINRWENEGGMVATSVPTMPDAKPQARPIDSRGDVGSGAGDPPLNI